MHDNQMGRPVHPLGRWALILVAAFAAVEPVDGVQDGGKRDARRVPRLVLSGAPQMSAISLHGGAWDEVAAPGGWRAIDPGLEEGDPIYFDVNPATIPLRGSRPIRARNFVLLGDFPVIEVSLRPAGPLRRFDRAERRETEGAVVSVFDLEFPRSDLYAGGPPPIRHDGISRALEGTTGFLRLSPSTLPKVPVVRINERVQYSSHVVNIVVPYDGLSVFSLPAEQSADEFYQHFSDSYEELAFIPERIYWSPYFGARHAFTYQDVGGIGLGPIDDRARFGGSTVLRDWLFYIRGDLQSNFLSVHETGHNWGWFISLFDAAGVVAQGPTECAGLEYDGTSVHAPVFGDAHTFLGQCIWSPLYLGRARGGLEVKEAPTPLSYHPLVLYAMGLIGPDEVPPMFLSSTQGAPSSLAPGAVVSGELTRVTIEDVIRRYGPRSGPPVPPVWRRAVIVVSPERLLSKKDLLWFNFQARRISDPDVTGVESLLGVPSIEVATGGRVDVQTEIRPLAGSPVKGDFEVAYPAVGRRDVVGLKLQRDLGSRFEPGRVHKISGKVTAEGRHETVDVRIGPRVFSAPINAKRRFTLAFELLEEDRGRHWMVIGFDGFATELARIAPVYVE